MCGRIGNGGPDLDTYKDYTEETKSKTYKLVHDRSDSPIRDFGEIMSNERRIGIEKAIGAINSWWDREEQDSYRLQETLIQSSTVTKPRWKGDFIWLSSVDYDQTMVRNYIEGTYICFHDETDETDMTKMQVKLNPSTSDNSAELTFKIWKDATCKQDTSIIGTWLVDTPLQLMAEIQAHVESCLSDVGFDTSEPVVDCWSDTKTESRSECSPDVIGRLHQAKLEAME
jgi:hypothetical protein